MKLLHGLSTVLNVADTRGVDIELPAVVVVLVVVLCQLPLVRELEVRRRMPCWKLPTAYPCPLHRGHLFNFRFQFVLCQKFPSQRIRPPLFSCPPR